MVGPVGGCGTGPGWPGSGSGPGAGTGVGPGAGACCTGELATTGVHPAGVRPFVDIVPSPPVPLPSPHGLLVRVSTHAALLLQHGNGGENVDQAAAWSFTLPTTLPYWSKT